MTPLVKLIDEPRLKSICGEAGMRFVDYCSDALPFSSYNMIEMRLDGVKREIDLSINYQRLPLDFGASGFSNPQWQSLQDFFDRWNNPDSVEHKFINDVWVELDYNALAENITPILFSTLTSLPKKDTGAVLSFIESCFDPGLSDNRRLLIEKLLHLLPAQATISHIGYMQNRAGQPLRFNIKKLNPELLAAILNAFEVKNSESIKDHCARYIPLCDSFTLAIDISEIIEPRIGIEFFFAWQQKDYPKISAFIDSLEADGLAQAEKAVAVKNWPSIEIIQPDSAKYPENLRRLSRFLYPEAVCSFWNIINHIKLVFEAEAVEAKAYLAYGHSCDAAGAAAQTIRA
jgi:hypothetical protein